MIYITSIFFTLSFAFYSKYQFADDNLTINTGKWHPFGMIMRILMIVGVFVEQYLPSTWEDFLLAGAINILLFEFAINIIALKQNLWHVGTTAKTDLKYGKRKWLIAFVFLVIAIFVKIKF